MIERRTISSEDTIEVDERRYRAVDFVCPSCDLLYFNLDIEKRGSALWRTTCPQGHSWDVYPQDMTP